MRFENGRMLVRVISPPIRRDKPFDIFVLHRNSVIHAIQAACPHSGGPLDVGDIEQVNEKPCVVCPWHKIQFSLIDGCPQQKEPFKALTWQAKLDACLFIKLPSSTSIQSFGPARTEY